ncbi:unnamed protein product [Pieris brassicae]|uniref:Uncharacterized protein n=1 Tax=Pieris brassicae TaxID=7116 RepID=A0A9P0TPN2_PIEBR|nr:unnamed protein product [Pieris brassicae]
MSDCHSCSKRGRSTGERQWRVARRCGGGGVTLGRRRDRYRRRRPAALRPPCPRLALADDPTAPKWRNDAEAVTPHARENGDFAI